jgi:hypothetical protein
VDQRNQLATGFGRLRLGGRGARLLTLALALALALAGCASGPKVSDPAAGAARFDGLEPIEGARVAMAYIDPDADFSVFRRVAILDPHVAFRSKWQRDHNRSRSRNISNDDMERIKTDVASLFREVFCERLQANDGYEVVDVIGDDVLLLRPAIVDLDISAPDTRAAGRTRTYSASAGAATLYIELFDSVSGEILGRAADRRTARNSAAGLTWSNGVTNTAEARRMFGRWADQLRAFLDAHYTK